MKILKLSEIKRRVQRRNIMPYLEQGFIEFSNGNVILPPVGELIFNDPPGDVHIKYGYILNDDNYIIKIASGFYNNPSLNLPSSNGLMLLFSKKTGELLTILLDEGYLTDVRTAIAGAIAAKYLAPSTVTRIGIVGTGVQARLQLKYLQQIRPCKDVIVLGRTQKKSLQYKADMEYLGFKVEIAETSDQIMNYCNLIVTTTAAKKPILMSKELKPGTHITAVGADTPGKQELDENIFNKSDLVVVDSVSQCLERGDTSHAVKKKVISKNSLVELGNIISGKESGRIDDSQITLADLTGLAVQDIQITKAIL